MARAPRRISFRSALVVTVLAILLATVGVVGVFSYLNARFIVGDLSGHVLDQTAERIHDRIRSLLDRAALISDVQKKYLAGRSVTAKDFPKIVRQFYDSILLSTDLTYISLGLETGAYCHAYRAPDGSIELRMREIQADGRTLQSNYVVDGDQLHEVSTDFDDYDPRVRPYYVRAKRLGHQTWPRVYLFKNQPNEDYPGLTCATPIYREDGSFQVC